MNDEDTLHKHIQLDGRETEAETEAKLKAELIEGSGEPPAPPEAPAGTIKQFYRDFVMVLTEPKFFFEKRFPETTFTHAMLFSIAVNLIASFLGWLTRLIRHETLFDSLQKMRDKLQELPYWKNVPDNFWAQSVPEPSSVMPAWSFEVMGIVLSPLQTMIHVAFFGIMLLLGCFMLVPKTTEGAHDAVDLKTTMRIIAFVSAPMILTSMLGFLPMSLAGVIYFFYALALTVIALSIRFRVSVPRAFGIVILPDFLALSVFGCIIGAAGALFFGLIASIFGGGN